MRVADHDVDIDLDPGLGETIGTLIDVDARGDARVTYLSLCERGVMPGDALRVMELLGHEIDEATQSLAGLT